MDKISSIVSKHRIAGNRITYEGFMHLWEVSAGKSREISHFLFGNVFLRLMEYQCVDGTAYYVMLVKEPYYSLSICNTHPTPSECMLYFYRDVGRAVRAYKKRTSDLLNTYIV